MKIRSLFITLGWLISSMLIHAAPPPMMEHYKTHGDIYQPYELQDCHKKDISQSHRDIIRERVLIEFKKYRNDLIRIDIQDRQCAFNKKKQPLGSALLVYSTVQSLDKAHDEYKKTKDIHKLLTSEQYGVFLYDSSLNKFIRTLNIFPSERWRDYMASIKFDGDNNLLLISQGSTYGDNYKEIKFKELFNSSNE